MLQENFMKSTKLLSHKPQPSPSKQRMMERPDNGSRGSIRSGPSSGHRRDNPHVKAKHVVHAS